MTDEKNLENALLDPLRAQARREDSRIRVASIGLVRHGDCSFHLQRVLFRGLPGGDSPIRLGFFAAIHGDEPEGAWALREFLLQLDRELILASGYELYVYPICNPSGFVDETRHSRAGCDLNREFWCGSRQPEIVILEREIRRRQFGGIVALHGDDLVDGAYAFVRGATLTEALAKPMLAAAARFLPLASGEIIDGFPARDGLISQCYEGVLSNPVELKPLPFEIIFETPQRLPASRQIAAAVAALSVLLREYREFLAYGQYL